jgi:hypothetical protein
VFVVLRMAVPFMGFGRLKMPAELPKEVQDKIAELESTSAGQNFYLQAAYVFVTGRWHAGRLATVFYAPLAFRKNISEIWQSSEYAHCNTQNYLLFLLLTGSKFFKPEDIKIKTVFFNFFIHQYLSVKTEKGWVSVDPAGASIHGKKLGEYISFFG